ncbi:DNA mismatch repair protein MutS [Haloarcula vallismortis]|uniref:DNA mismatch repair protein MutS n=2 Tax=Haloarcula vallismortis TaxID=28442 RepID=M0JKZ9_HALVA|nr:DNA mismatch repair protein MutS [Haloarcula vallismortis]EMA08654.1 DNA mismatch repair protein MutS [Haloarcula vallismortis ATCC 29715]SDX18319.1 DNA mismatch repair protein MutS [Haloarcula vallismortis]
MDAALGPPEQMAELEEELTPMMAQYYELCRQYDDALVLFQVGDFYEAFCAAAQRVARLCEITLTQREDSTGEYPMAGIPIDNAESYVETLLDAGYRVAIADQVEDPDEVSGVVERAVTRIVTPGTLTESELLGGADNNYVAALTEGERYGLALLDVSTGDCYATSVGSENAVADELSRFGPAEAIVGPEVDVDRDAVFGPACLVTRYDADAFARERAADRVGQYFGPPERLLAGDAEIRACGGLLAYAEYTRGSSGAVGPDGEPVDPDVDPAGTLDYLNHLTRYDPREYMLLDAVAVESLELFERRSVRGHENRTLVDTVDETACALGRRKLTDWLRRPLLDADRIEARHGAVAELQRDPATRESLADLLAEVYDLERLISRVSRGRANARDLRSLAATLSVVPDIRDQLADADARLLADLHATLDPLAETREEIEAAIRTDPPQQVTEGGVISEGYDEELDRLRSTEQSGKQWIDDLEASERERTGIDSLKVGHNSVHGYYIEVTNANLDSVPKDYQRRQTLKNSERYYTPELKEHEEEILRAESAADDLEYDLFCAVRDEVAGEAERVQALADRLARLDVLVSFAEVAAQYDYCRPTVGSDGIDITAGRHPVVERTEDAFVPNDTHLGSGPVPESGDGSGDGVAADDIQPFLAVVTGPNMSGKSTYMRQVALICLLAQAGGFVPAKAADLPILDRVFTRVGASDDIAGGRSTFMIEMTELATILDAATADSLVLLDEVGRGTSTADGLAIARAVTEFLHDEVGAYTLFATHHHDLTAVAADLSGATNRHFETSREDGDVAFDHELAPGPAAASYGVEVASMAGVPESVVERSRDLLGDAEAADGDERNTGGAAADAGADSTGTVTSEVAGNGATAENGAMAENGAAAGETATDGHREARRTNGTEVEGEPPESVTAQLASLDVATMTPIEAMNALAALQDRVE